MSKVQEESRTLSEIEEKLKNLDRQLAVVTKTTDQIHNRLNDVRIEQALPSEQEEPLNKEKFAHLPGAPFTPDKAKIKTRWYDVGICDLHFDSISLGVRR